MKYFSKSSTVGMTILELVVSLGIVAVLVSIAIPASLAALNTTDFIRCLVLRSELGRKTILYACEKFGENPTQDSTLPFHIDQLKFELNPYGVTKEHFICPAVERKLPEFAGDVHFIPTGVTAWALKQVNAVEYTMYFECYKIHGQGIVEVRGDGSAIFQPLP